MLEIKQASTATPLLFLMVDSGDGKTPKTGLTPTVLVSKNGAAFAAPTGAVAEVGLGIYKLTPTAADTGTLGALVLNATAAAAYCTPMQYAVVTHTRAEVMGAIAGLNNVSLAQIVGGLNNVSVGQIVSALNNVSLAQIEGVLADLGSDGLVAELLGNTELATFSEGTPGAALHRLTLTPANTPVIVLPNPAEDEADCTVFIDTQEIDNTRTAGVQITMQLVGGPTKTASGRVLAVAKGRTMTTDGAGRAQMTLERTDLLVPQTRKYLVTCPAYGLAGVELTLTSSTFNLADLVTA